MPTLLVILQIDPEAPLGRLARGALEHETSRRGLTLDLQFTRDDPAEALRSEKITADAVILGAPSTPARPSDSGQRLMVSNLVELVRETRERVSELFPEPASEAGAEEAADTAAGPRFVVAVTSCPTGIAHTFMAAESLNRAAKSLGFEIKVETRGSVGAKNELTAADIARADAVVVAADAHVETARFAGKRLLETGVKAAIKDGPGLIEQALALPEPTAASGGELSEGTASENAKKPRSGAYKHLMTGVSHMLPLVVAGGLLIALSFAIGGIYVGEAEGTLGWALMQVGSGAAFALFIPVLAGFIAFSIADRPGLTPGLIGGMLAAQLGAGFLGGLAAGFFAGYLTRWLNKVLRLPESMQGLKPVLVLPLLTSMVVGLAMIFVIGPPVSFLLAGLTDWLAGMQQSSALILGLILGGMMAVDMGGPINKSAYTFAVGLLASQVYPPMAAVMAAGMVPPLAVALAATLFRRKFTLDERKASKATAILGASFITEGAIPYAAVDPVRVIPCLVAGAAVTGGLSMAWGCQLMAPHGGIFVLAIPNAINHVFAYIAALVIGVMVSTATLYFAKRPLQVPPKVPTAQTQTA